MFWLTYSMIILSLQSFEAKSTSNINVMVSHAEPFVYFDVKKQSLKGLDVEIIKNFAKKFNLKINYIVTNETLNEVFSSENRVVRFSES